METAAGSLTGFHINKQTLAVTQLWSSVFSTPKTALLEVAARDPAEQVYSQAKVIALCAYAVQQAKTDGCRQFV